MGSDISITMRETMSASRPAFALRATARQTDRLAALAAVEKEAQTLNALVPLTALALALGTLTAAGAQSNVDELLMRVGERVAEFYQRAKNVICIETSRFQPIDSSHSPQCWRGRRIDCASTRQRRKPGEAFVLRKFRK